MSSAANENVGSAKVLSFGLITHMDEAATLRLFGAAAGDAAVGRAVDASSSNVVAFSKGGWGSVMFPTGLAIVSKLQEYDDTDTAMADQEVVVGEGEWGGGDCWVP